MHIKSLHRKRNKYITRVYTHTHTHQIVAIERKVCVCIVAEEQESYRIGIKRDRAKGIAFNIDGRCEHMCTHILEAWPQICFQFNLSLALAIFNATIGCASFLLGDFIDCFRDIQIRTIKIERQQAHSITFFVYIPSIHTPCYAWIVVQCFSMCWLWLVHTFVPFNW